MAVNFAQAARRHYDDSGTLVDKQRLGNASHLAGLAAECALKAVLEGLGRLVLTDKGLPEKEQHRKHIDIIWDEFQADLAGREALYALQGTNPFVDWRISQRYEDDRTIDQAMAERHREGSRTAMLLLERAQLGGDVR